MHVGATIARRYVLDSEDSYDLDGVQRFIAHDTRLDRKVNVDIVTCKAPSAVVSAAGRARVLRDKRLARVLAAGRERIGGASVPYIVTERPAGIHVADLLGKVVFVPDAAAAVVGEAAAALQVAVQAGEHHGMVRPSALFVTDRGRVIVSGMGIDGELAVQAGRSRGRGEKADAVALAKVFLTAITGMPADEVTVDDLPDDLSPAAAKLARAAVKGSGPKRLADVTAALGVGDTRLLRAMAEEAPSLWWPSAPVVEAVPSVETVPADALPVVETVPADASRTVGAPLDVEAPARPVQPDAPARPEGPAPDDHPTQELPPVEAEILTAAEGTGTEVEVSDIVDAEVVRTDELPVVRPRTRFGGAVDDIDEFHDILTDQSRTTKPTIVEVTLQWLHARYPDAQPLAQASEAARRRAQLEASINPGPLLVGLGVVALFVASMLALDAIGREWEPDFERYNLPAATYPVFTFGPDGPGASSDQP